MNTIDGSEPLDELDDGFGGGGGFGNPFLNLLRGGGFGMHGLSGMHGMSGSGSQMSLANQALSAYYAALSEEAARDSAILGALGDYLSGFSDGVLLGQGHYLAKLAYGSDTPWGDTSSGWYTGGMVTGIGAQIVATGGYGTGSFINRFGANSSIVGKGSRIFGSGAFRNSNGLLNNNNIVRVGWGPHRGSSVFRFSVGPNFRSNKSITNRFYNYIRHVRY
jgi:hypothetical protein